MNPSGCMTSPQSMQRYAEAGFPISLLCSFRFSLRLCVNPSFGIFHAKAPRGTRSRQANFRRGMQNAHLSTTRSLSLPVLTPMRRCVPQTTRKPKPKTRRPKTKAPQTAILQSLPISLLCSFRFSLRLCVNPLSEYFTQRRQGNQKPPSNFRRGMQNAHLSTTRSLSRCHTPKFMNEKRAARRPLIHTTSTRQDAPRERHLRAPSGRQECYSYYVLLFVDFVLEFVDLAGITLS